MTITLLRDWEFFDGYYTGGEKPRQDPFPKKIIPAGEHLVEVIRNPWPKVEDSDYVVLAGTSIGLGFEFLRAFTGEFNGVTGTPNGIHQVVFKP